MVTFTVEDPRDPWTFVSLLGITMIVLDTEADARLPSCGLPMLCKFYFVFF